MKERMKEIQNKIFLTTNRFDLNFKIFNDDILDNQIKSYLSEVIIKDQPVYKKDNLLICLKIDTKESFVWFDFFKSYKKRFECFLNFYTSENKLIPFGVYTLKVSKVQLNNYSFSHAYENDDLSFMVTCKILKFRRN